MHSTNNVAQCVYIITSLKTILHSTNSKARLFPFFFVKITVYLFYVPDTCIISLADKNVIWNNELENTWPLSACIYRHLRTTFPGDATGYMLLERNGQRKTAEMTMTFFHSCNKFNFINRVWLAGWLGRLRGLGGLGELGGLGGGVGGWVGGRAGVRVGGRAGGRMDAWMEIIRRLQSIHVKQFVLFIQIEKTCFHWRRQNYNSMGANVHNLCSA